MMRVRRRHHRTPCTRPATRARRPLTRLVTVDEAFELYDMGLDIGMTRAEDDYDRGYIAGARDMMDRLLGGEDR